MAAEETIINEMVEKDVGFLDPYESTQGVADLKRHEGTVGNVYTDTGGVLHYGTGHKMTEEEVEAYQKSGKIKDDVTYASNVNFPELTVSQDKIDKTFALEYRAAVKEAQHYVGDKWDETPNDIKDATINFIFNVGLPTAQEKFPGFRGALKKGDYGLAADHLIYVNPLKKDEKGDIVKEIMNSEGEMVSNISKYSEDVGQRAIDLSQLIGQY